MPIKNKKILKYTVRDIQHVYKNKNICVMVYSCVKMDCAMDNGLLNGLYCGGCFSLTDLRSYGLAKSKEEEHFISIFLLKHCLQHHSLQPQRPPNTYSECNFPTETRTRSAVFEYFKVTYCWTHYKTWLKTWNNYQLVLIRQNHLRQLRHHTVPVLHWNNLFKHKMFYHSIQNILFWKFWNPKIDFLWVLLCAHCAVGLYIIHSGLSLWDSLSKWPKLHMYQMLPGFSCMHHFLSQYITAV